jgi:hypothetical protein
MPMKLFRVFRITQDGALMQKTAVYIVLADVDERISAKFGF